MNTYEILQKAYAEANGRIEQLERENQQHLDYINTLCQEIKTEQRLSFRDQVARLERENAELKAEVNRLLGIHKTLETAWNAFSKFEDKKQPGRVIEFDNRFKK